MPFFVILPFLLPHSTTKTKQTTTKNTHTSPVVFQVVLHPLNNFSSPLKTEKPQFWPSAKAACAGFMTGLPHLSTLVSLKISHLGHQPFKKNIYVVPQSEMQGIKNLVGIDVYPKIVHNLWKWWFLRIIPLLISSCTPKNSKHQMLGLG